MPDNITDPSSASTIQNRRLKISPGGLISLPAAVRRSLKMVDGAGGRVTVAVADRTVVLMQAGSTGGFRISRNGQLELRGEAKRLLAEGVARHYWVELCDLEGKIKLHPYKD